MEIKVSLPQIKIINLLLGRLGLMDEKKEFVHQYSDGKATSTKDLTSTQARYLIASLKKMVPQTEEQASVERQHKKIFALAQEAGWELANGKVDTERLHGWINKFGYLKKELKAYTHNELPKLITQLERSVDWITKGK
jgi:hypothetical protein